MKKTKFYVEEEVVDWKEVMGVVLMFLVLCVPVLGPLTFVLAVSEGEDFKKKVRREVFRE